MNTVQGKPVIAQVRLLIPKHWVQELDALADFRVSSRLALIRHFIRTSLDRELATFDEQVKNLTQMRETLFKKHNEIFRR